MAGKASYDPVKKQWVTEGSAKPGDKMAPLPKTEEEKDREEYESKFGKIGIGNQSKFAAWRRAKKGGALSNLAK